MAFSLLGLLGKATGAKAGTGVITQGGTSTGTSQTIVAPGKTDVTTQLSPPADGGTPTIGAPAAPDSTLLASQAAMAAQQAAARQQKKAQGASSLLTGTPGAATPPATTKPRSLLGY